MQIKCLLNSLCDYIRPHCWCFIHNQIEIYWLPLLSETMCTHGMRARANYLMANVVAYFAIYMTNTSNNNAGNDNKRSMSNRQQHEKIENILMPNSRNCILLVAAATTFACSQNYAINWFYTLTQIMINICSLQRITKRRTRIFHFDRMSLVVYRIRFISKSMQSD